MTTDLLQPADALAAYLRGVPALGGIDVHVDRQMDPREAVAASVAKADGAAILIGLQGWAGPRAEVPVDWEIRPTYSISLWTVPVMRPEHLPCSRLLAALIRAVHGWDGGESTPGHWCGWHWRTRDGRLIPDLDFLIFEFPAEFGVDLEPLDLTQTPTES